MPPFNVLNTAKYIRWQKSRANVSARLTASVVILSLSSLLAACSSLPEENQALKDKMVHAIGEATSRPKGDTVLIKMTTIADFPWDTVYVFPSITVVEGISQAIGVPWPNNENVHEREQLFVFMYKSQIADYIYLRNINFEKEPKFVKLQAHFNIGELFTPSTALFKATRSDPYTVGLFPPHKPSVFRPKYDPKSIRYQPLLML